MEGNPEVFTRFAQQGAIDKVRAAVAAYVALTDDVVLVDNASHGMNASSARWRSASAATRSSWT